MKYIFNNLTTKFFLIFILFINNYISQIEVKVCQPGALTSQWTEENLKKIIENGAHCFDGNAFWQVRSIAKGVQTFKDKEGVAPKTNLEYLQGFVVQNIDSKNAMLHIYEPIFAGPKLIDESAKDWGWVSIYDVLPSDFPKGIQEDRIVFQEKAMPTYILRDRNMQKAIEEIHFFNSFKGSEVIPNKQVISQVPYYIFAKRGSRYLLSRKANVTITKGDAITSEMGGWIEKEYVQIIRNRICWEPCWSRSAYDFYKGLDFHVYKEDRKVNATSFRNLGINNENHVISTKYEVSNGRENISGRRAIQIDRERSGIVKVLVRGNADKNYSSEDIEKQGKSVEDLKESLRKLNILFVIDGTKSMKPYFESTARAIESSMQEIKKMGSLQNSIVNEINFAVSVYRDKKNINTKDYEELDFTSSYEIDKVTSFLRSVECDSKGDKDIAENVYEGLYKALGEFKKNQKNVVILIGDAGDHQTSENDKLRHKNLEKKIIELSEEFFVSWSVFQVNRKNGKDEYNDFISNAKKIIMSTAKKIDKNSINKPKIYQNKSNYYEDNYTTTLDLDFNENDSSNLEDYLMFGNVLQPEDGASMEDVLLTQAITNSIIKMRNSTRAAILSLEGGSNSVPYRKILKAYGKSDREIELLNEMGFRIPGFLPINTIKGQTLAEDGMCKVIMMTETELQSQIKLLKKLSSASQSTNIKEVRESLIEALTDKMVQVTGNSGAKNIDEVKEQIQDYLLNEVWISLFGKLFTFDDERGEKFSISDMNRVSNFPNEWIRRFADALADKYDLIKGESVENCLYKEKTGLKTGNNSDYIMYYPYNEFFP